jgi:hypothetical protein
VDKTYYLDPLILVSQSKLFSSPNKPDEFTKTLAEIMTGAAAIANKHSKECWP